MSSIFLDSIPRHQVGEMQCPEPGVRMKEPTLKIPNICSDSWLLLISRISLSLQPQHGNGKRRKLLRKTGACVGDGNMFGCNFHRFGDRVLIPHLARKNFACRFAGNLRDSLKIYSKRLRRSRDIDEFEDHIAGGRLARRADVDCIEWPRRPAPAPGRRSWDSL